MYIFTIKGFRTIVLHLYCYFHNVSADMSSRLLRNVEEITIKMKTIVRKPLMIKINKLRLRNLDKKFTVTFRDYKYCYQLQRRRIKRNLIETFKIINGIFSY